MPCAVFIFFITIKPRNSPNAFCFVLFVKSSLYTFHFSKANNKASLVFVGFALRITNPWRFSKKLILTPSFF
jgi:hypothetical protein